MHSKSKTTSDVVVELANSYCNKRGHVLSLLSNSIDRMETQLTAPDIVDQAFSHRLLFYDPFSFLCKSEVMSNIQ